MRATASLFGLMAVLAASVPALALPEPSAEELERNRNLLEVWRADPEHYLRLRHDLREFYRLSPEEQDRLRLLDHDLHAADSRAQKRLYAVMERYAAWLERLPEEQQRQIAAAPNPESRLQLVREIRIEQWVRSQPAAVRDRLAKLGPAARAIEVAELRRKELERRRQWEQLVQAAAEPPHANPKPARLGEFPLEVQQYVDRVLRPQLSLAEREQLQRSGEEPWPALARTVRELADRHPAALPGPRGPVRFKALPAAVQSAMPPESLTQPQRQRLNRAGGKWPQFAEEFAAVAKLRDVSLPVQLGACRPAEFGLAVQGFLSKELLPKLAPEEAARLRKAEGQWPDYPRLILDLARKHGLVVPGMTLPGPKELWDRARTASVEPPVPDVPDRTLRDFAQHELTREERSALRISVDDPASRERLRAKYFEKHPKQFQRQQRIDRQYFGAK